MFSVRTCQTLLLVAALAVTPAFASRTHRAPTAGHRHGRRLHLRLKRSTGQRSIDAERATEIQKALIHENYLGGAPSGKWDTGTVAAMQKYQSDHGWQTKLVPDSRALISLGLGPNHATDLAPAKAASGEAPQAPGQAGPAAEPTANTLASVHSISQ